MVGAAARQQLFGQHAGVGFEAGVYGITARRRRCHDIAHHVAAGGQRRQKRMIDGADS